eukprot:m.1279441 g.1279441  ORF g.1279441 m.1279441 type:complete len:192 (+) comp24768_c1_seq1:2375-2950(+)
MGVAACVITPFLFCVQGASGPQGYVYSSYSGSAVQVLAWYFVSFKIKTSYDLVEVDFYPALSSNTKGSLLTRVFNDGPCINGSKASTCVRPVSYAGGAAVTIPPSDFSNTTGGTDFVPAVTTVYSVCASGWAILGELDKYVPLAATRFRDVTCTSDGVTWTLLGTQGEKVSVRATDSACLKKATVRHSWQL